MYNSVTDRSWKLKEISIDRITTIMQKFDVSELQARLIASREPNFDLIQHFIDPKIKNLMNDPYELLDMDKAVNRTLHAIKTSEKICIYGDYDVDGATSSALLRIFFESLGLEVMVYIPDRIRDGYGLSAAALSKIKAEGIDLVITVDSGSLAHEAIDAGNVLGLDTIVIDHHLTLEHLPNAIAVINPNRLDEKTKYTYLAAVGVSFLFAVGLISALKKDGYFERTNLIPINLMDLMDLVALGTVCDVMPLVGLNRAFVKQGLKVLASRKNIGLKALSDIASIDQAPTCYHLGFVLGPRINAGGRVGESFLGSKLLSTKCEFESREIVEKLEIFNNERKKLESEIIAEAKLLGALQVDQNIILVSGDWHPGVIGVVAGKLKELYKKPVAVVSIIEGICKASCRSVKGVDFGSALAEAKQLDLVEVGGGHAMAAGFTTSELKLDALHKFLNEKFAKYQGLIAQGLISEYELELTSSAISKELHAEIHMLAPFGQGNNEPLVKVNDLFVLKAYIVGEKHISCLFANDRNSYKGQALKAIIFNSVGTKIEEYILSKMPHKLSIIGTIQIQHYNGNAYPQIVVQDIIVD
jgi:single-stranded-DNA-specific exonuclease